MVQFSSPSTASLLISSANIKSTIFSMNHHLHFYSRLASCPSEHLNFPVLSCWYLTSWISFKCFFQHFFSLRKLPLSSLKKHWFYWSPRTAIILKWVSDTNHIHRHNLFQLSTELPLSAGLDHTIFTNAPSSCSHPPIRNIIAKTLFIIYLLCWFSCTHT